MLFRTAGEGVGDGPLEQEKVALQAVRLQKNTGTGSLGGEILRGKYGPVEETEGKPVNQRLAVDFQKVQGQGLVAAGRFVQEAQPGVQTLAHQGAEDLPQEKHVPQAEESIDRIAGRTAVALGESDPLLPEAAPEHSKVYCGTLPFHTSHLGRGAPFLESGEEPGQLVSRPSQLGVGMVTGLAAQQGPMVAHFYPDNRPGDIKAIVFILPTPHLGQPAFHILAVELIPSSG
jgi:hypothetical protein